MLRSCAVLLAAYAGLFAIYAWWLGQQFESPGQYIGAGIMALGTGGSLGALYNGRVAHREWSLIAAARHGLPWSDGRWTAVVGELHPAADPITTPFTGETCVLCEYEIVLPNTQPASSDGRHSTGADFAGFLMNPCVVRSAFGEVRLLGFPNLVGIGWRICHFPAVEPNARAFLLGTEFENLSGLKLVTVFSAIKAAWTDDDGYVRKHLRLGKKTPAELFPEPDAAAVGSLTDQKFEGLAVDGSAEREAMNVDEEAELDEDKFDEDELDEDELDADDDDFDDDFDDSIDYEAIDDNPELCPTSYMMLKEKRVKLAEKVCAFGIYNGEKRGLVPGGLGADRFIKLVRGNATTIEHTARSSFVRNLFGGIVSLIVVHAAGWGAMLAAAAQK